MVVDRDSGTQIQAFPIHEKTYISPDTGMTGFNTKNGKYTTFHAVMDGTLQVTFGANVIVLDVLAGTDLSIDIDTDYIDYDAKCWVS